MMRARIRETEVPVEFESGLSVSELLKRLLAETGELVRAEANVIKLEMQENTRAMIIDGIKAAVYSGIALLGVLSLVAFLVIGLGDLLTQGEYGVRGFWISALIVGLVLGGIGGVMAYRHAKHLGQHTSFAQTKHALRNDRVALKEGINKIKEAATP